MNIRLNNYQDAIDFISLHPNKSLVANADGGLRQKSFADTLRSFGSFLVGGYRKNLDARNAAVANTLLSLHAGSPSAPSPHSIPGFKRYFQAKVNLQARQAKIQSKADSKVSKGAINSLAGAKKVSPQELGKHIFDTKAKSYQLNLGDQLTSEILGSIESLAHTTDKVGGIINSESGLAEQYHVDIHRQDNFFTDSAGVTKKTTTPEETIQTLKELTGSLAAAKAVSCVANQASIITLSTKVSKNLAHGILIAPVINGKDATQEHHVSKLSNGNIQYQFNYYAPLSGISSDNDDFIETQPWKKPYPANAQEHDLHLSACIELDAAALNEGRVQIVKNQALVYNISLKPVTQ